MGAQMIDREVAAAVTAVLRRQPDVVAAYLFGSHARGTSRPGSDVDVAVLLGSPRDPERRLELIADLAAAVAPQRVDVVVLEDAPVALAFRVLQDGVLLVGHQDVRRVRHAAGVMDRYFDMAPARRMVSTGLQHRLAEGRFGRR